MYQTVQCFIQSKTGVLYVTERYSVSTYKELQKTVRFFGSACQITVLVLQLFRSFRRLKIVV